MKIIAIGDPHFKTDNIPEVNVFIEILIKIATDYKPDFIIVLGDLLDTHERLHTIPLNKACEFIDRLRKISKTIVLVGNHDMCNNQQFLTTNHWMNVMKQWEGVEIVDKILHINQDGYHFVFCPFVPPGRFQEALNSDGKDWKSADCVFAHQEFFGCKMGAIDSVDGDRWPENFPYIISGHIHDRQNPQKNIYYCGSSMQHGFGETGGNIIPFLSWEFPGEQYILEEIDLELPGKKNIRVDIKNIEDLKLPQTEKTSGIPGEKIKIVVSGEYEEFKAWKKTEKYRELTEAGIKIMYKAKKKKDVQKACFSEAESSDFSEILSALVAGENNTALYRAYEYVINGKIIAESDVFFLQKM